MNRRNSDTRRQELRRQCTPTETFVIVGDVATPVAATVLEVSGSGIGLKLQSFIAIGVPARIEFERLVVDCRIRFCKPSGDGTFDAGMQIISSVVRGCISD